MSFCIGLFVLELLDIFWPSVDSRSAKQFLYNITHRYITRAIYFTVIWRAAKGGSGWIKNNKKEYPLPPENFEFFSMEMATFFGEFSYAVGQSSSL